MVKALRNGSPRLAWAVALCMGLSGWAVALVLAWKHDQRMGQVQAQVDDLRHRVMPLDLKRTMAGSSVTSTRRGMRRRPRTGRPRAGTSGKCSACRRALQRPESRTPTVP